METNIKYQTEYGTLPPVPFIGILTRWRGKEVGRIVCMVNRAVEVIVLSSETDESFVAGDMLGSMAEVMGLSDFKPCDKVTVTLNQSLKELEK